MFIVEFIVNFWKQRYHTEKPQELPPLDNEQYIPLEDYETCEHIFMPIDSTGEILACSKCGLVKKKSEIKKKNFFENK